jgi:predicted nucleic acid-binding protein
VTARGPRSRHVLIDSSAFYATLVPRDGHHAAGVAILSRLRTESWDLITTNFVVAETHGLFLTRLGRDRAFTFLSSIDAGATTIVGILPEDELTARDIIRRYDDKSFSLVDATCFAVMERLDIPAAFTFDRNFSQYGLNVLRP